MREKDSEKTDHELIILYRETEKLDWLGILYLRYASLIYGVCLKYLKDREAAKDAVMQIYEKLIESLLQHEVENFRSWLYVMARNHCLMQLRSQKSARLEEISPILMENGLGRHPDDEPEPELNILRMEKCLETLVEAQQQCVRLFYLQEKSYKVIAEMTGFELKEVKSHIQNGKRNLKICMDKNEE